MNQVSSRAAVRRARGSLSHRIAAIEPLEIRQLMTVAPSIPFGSTLPGAPMRADTIAAAISSATEKQSWKIALKKGDYLSADVDTQTKKSDLKFTVRGPDGKVVGSNDDAVDPTTRKWSLDPFLLLGAKSDGDYILTVQDSPKTKRPAGDENYTLKTQKFALTQGAAAPDLQANLDEINNPQGRWAWISGGKLIMSDSVGNGFAIAGNWKQNVVKNSDGTSSSTYTADKMYIDVAIPGEVKQDAQGHVTVGQSKTDRITINQPMTVATQASMYGYTVAPVDWTKFGSSIPSTSSSLQSAAPKLSSLASLNLGGVDATQLLNDFSSRFGLNVSTPGVGFGMGKGSDLDFLDAPLRPDGTYFYFTASNGFSASYGGVSASTGSGLLTLVIDPSDPFVYARVADLIEFGGSLRGMIPFVPQADNYTGPQFMGHLYGGVKGIQLGELPFNVDGDLLLNGDGVPLGLNGDASKLFKPGGLVGSVLNDVKVGANAAINFGYDIKGVNISVPLGAASFAYVPTHQSNVLVATFSVNGFPYYSYSSNLPDVLPSNYQVPSPTSYGSGIVASYSLQHGTAPTAIQLAGSSTDPLKGTPLAGVFVGNKFAFKASSTGYTIPQLVQNITARMDLTQGNGINLGGFLLGSSQRVGATLSRTQIQVDGDISILSGKASLSGSIDPSNGNFSLQGSINAGANLPFLPSNSKIASASASFLLARNYRQSDGTIFSGFKADLNLNFNLTATVRVLGQNVTAGATGSVYGSLNINTNGAFTGSFRATGTVVVPLIPDPSISVGASIDNNGITIDLPLVPDLRINFR